MALRDVKAVVTITTNATKAIDDGKKLKETYKATLDIIKQFRKDGKIDTDEGKELLKLADDLQAKIKTLVSGMDLIRGVVDNLSNKSGKDLNRALREISKEFNKTGNETDADKKKLEELATSLKKIKDDQSIRKGLVMPLKEAADQLKNINNVSFDKLDKGLKAIREKISSLSTAELEGSTGQTLRSAERQYEAQIAVREYGRAGSADISKMNNEQLRAEQQRLRSAYMATDGATGYEAISNEYINRLQQVNQLLKERAEAQAKADKAARDAAADQEREARLQSTLSKLYNGQSVSLKELTEAYKTLKDGMEQALDTGGNTANAYRNDMKSVEDAMKNILTTVNELDINKVFRNLDTQSLETLEETLKKVKENAANVKVGDDKAIQQTAERMDILEKKITEVKERMAGLRLSTQEAANTLQSVYRGQKVPLDELNAAYKTLQARAESLDLINPKKAQVARQQMKVLEGAIKNVNKELLTERELQNRVANSGKYNVQQLQQAYDQLKYKLSTLNAEEKEAIKETRKQMERLKKTINEVNGEVTGLEKIWRTAVRNIATYVGVFAGFNYVKGKIMEIVRGNVQLSDSMAQVQKVTGLTKKEVDDLNKSFNKLDTRTTLTQLNDLAYSAGKMGLGKYGVDGVRQFVEATNQLQVALGEDLGNSVEESITPLAKLAENLGLIQDMGVEKSMLAIGSSINELSQTTTATGKNIVDFARRIQPSAQMIGLATDEILALGSASDSFGIASEISATAFTKFLASYRTNAEEIERILGLTRGSLDQFFEQGRTMEGMMTIFQRMHEIGDLRYLEEAFKALGSEGSRMFTTFGAFSKNIDMFREHLETSRQAFKEATSVTNEYMLVQDTAAGIIERANNIWEKAFVNPDGVDMVKEMAVEWYNLTRQLTESETFMWSVRNSLAAIASVVGVLIQMLPYLVRAMMFYGVASTIKKLTVEWQLMSAAISAAGSGMGKFTAFLRSNIFVAAATAIGFVVSYLYDYATAQEKALGATEESTKAMERAKQAQDVYNNTMASNYGNLMSKYDELKRQWKSLKSAHEKNDWIKKNKTAFEELGITVGNAANAEEVFNKNTANVIEGFKRRAEAAALAAKMTQLYNQQMDIENEAQEHLNRYGKNAGDKVDERNLPGRMTRDQNGDTFNNGLYRLGNDGSYYYTAAGALEYNRQILKGVQADYDKINKQLDETAEKMEALGKKAPVAPVASDGGSGSGSGTKELNAEFREEQAKVKDIINKVKNFYQRQINAINEDAAAGTINEQQQKEMVEGMQVRMNRALAEVRKAIGGTENEWEEFKKSMIDDLYEPLRKDGTNWSTELVQDIVDNDLVQLRKMIQTLSNSLKKNGQQLLEQILRKATEDEGRIIDLQNKQMRARQEELRRKNYTEQTDYNYINIMDQFQIGDTTEAQNAQIQAWSQEGNKKAIENFFDERTKLWREGFKQARENLLGLINADIETEQGRKDLMTLLYGEDYENTLKGSALEGLLSMDATQWKLYYQKLIEYTDAWDDAQKKMYEEQKKRMEYRFNNRADVQGLNQMEQDYESQHRDNARWGKPQSMAERMGLGSLSNITNDPEVKAMEVRLTRAELFYKDMEKLRQANLVSQEMANDAHQKMMDAQIALQDKVAEHARQKMEQIQQLLDPIKDFGAAAGEAMYMTVNGLDGEGEAWRNAIKSIIKTYGEMTIQMIEKQLIQMLVLKQHHQEQEDEEQAHQDRMKQIQGQGDTNQINAQNALNAKIISVKKKGDKAEQQEEKKSEEAKTQIAGEGGEQLLDITTTVASGVVNAEKERASETQKVEQQQQATSLSGLIADTTAKVVLGIAGGSAKTISELGWWGLPLVAVISAALMGLLNYALSAIGGSSQSNNTSTKKTKLTSGMLTYDEGNVQTVVGDDGHVYRARSQKSLPEGVGIVKSPIATTVNGQQALVGERGPEIVIGRKTTRALMMNRPDILAALNTVDRGITTRRVRTFDEGNISDLASVFAAAQGDRAAVQSDNSTSDQSPSAAERDAMLVQTMQQMLPLMQGMVHLLENPVAPEIAMYGENGLHKKMKKADAFYARYGD